jgi:PAS domain S-box-containing protein
MAGKRIEEELRISEERYKMLFEYMTNAVVILQSRSNGDDYVVRDINQAGQWLDKVKREDVIDVSIAEAQPSVMKNGVFETIQRVWRFGEPAHFPVSIYENGQTSGWREFWIYKLPSGEIVLLYEDIKDWQRIEEKLHRTEYRNRALLEAVPDAIFLYSHSGICIDYIPGLETGTDLSPGDIIEKHIHDFMPRDVADTIIRGIQSTLATGESMTMEYSLLQGEKIHHYEGRMSASGRDEVIFIVRDISEQKELFRKLRREEERFRNIVEYLPIGYSEVDAEMNVTYANDAAYGITGFTEEDVRGGLSLRVLFPDFEEAKKNFKLGMEGKRPHPAKYRLRRKDGREIDVLIKATPIHIGGKPAGIRNIIIDVSCRA